MDLVQRYAVLSYLPGANYYATNRPVYLLLCLMMELSLRGGVELNGDGLVCPVPGMTFSTGYLQEMYGKVEGLPAKTLTGWLDHYMRRLTFKEFRQVLQMVLASLDLAEKKQVPEALWQQEKARLQVCLSTSRGEERDDIILCLLFGSGLGWELFTAEEGLVDWQAYGERVTNPLCRQVVFGTKYWNGYAGGVLAN